MAAEPDHEDDVMSLFSDASFSNENRNDAMSLFSDASLSNEHRNDAMSLFSDASLSNEHRNDAMSLFSDSNFSNEQRVVQKHDDSSNDQHVRQKNDDPPELDDFEDESFAERLLGLTEMFPANLRKCVYNVGSCLCTCTKSLYAFSCSATWLFFSSSAILFAPVLFELERVQAEELHRTQQKQVLLGPNTALSNVNPHGLPMPASIQ